MSVNVEYIIKLNDQLTSKLKVAQGQVDRLNKKVNTTKSSFAGLGSTFAKIGGIVAVGMLAKQVFTLGTEMEKTRISFTTFLGGTEEAAKGADALIKKLNEFANVTPFTNDQVIKASRTLLAFGVAADDLQPTLKTLGDISAGTGKDLSELGVIYGQIRGAGRLMGQDLLQLINAGFNPLQQMIKTTGKTMPQLKEEMRKGAISFKQVEQAFKDATSEGGRFNNLMKKQSESVGGRISILVGKLQVLGVKIGEALLPAIGFFVDLGVKLIDNKDLLITLASIVGTVAAAWAAFNTVALITNGLIALQTWYTGLSTTAIILNTLVTEGLSAAWVALNVAMSANPWGLVIAALAAVAAGIYLAWKNSETFRGIIYGLWEAAKSVFNNIKELAVNVFGGLGDLMKGVFTFDTDLITQGLEKLRGNFSRFGERVSVDFAKGFAKGKAPIVKTEEDGTVKTTTGSLTSGATPTTGTGDLKAGITDVKASAPKTFNINIEKLVESLNVNTTNLKDSASRIKDEVQKALITAVTDSSIISE
jgi:tape measure domain-containing protein